MRILLDTHAFVWWLTGSPRLSRAALAALEDAGNRISVSAAVAWEIATKVRSGKWPDAAVISADIGNVLAARGLGELPISVQHAQMAGAMPGSHRDPFDRILAAQALIEGARLVTADPVFTAFRVEVIW